MAYEFFRYGEPHPCLVVNPHPPGPVMTIPIVGVPRGGTTLVAAVVHALGVDIGPVKDLAEFTFEDQTMNKAEFGLQLSYITKRNRERKIWGWKNPTAVVSIRSLFFCLRNPRMIVVFRDIMASIDSEMRFDEAKNIEPRRTFPDLAKATLNWWNDNMEFVSQTTFPVLLVSYERALQMPEVFIHDVSAFLGITPDHNTKLEAIARINPHGGYLKMDEQAHPIQIVEPLPEIMPPEAPEAPELPVEPPPEPPPDPEPPPPAE